MNCENCRYNRGEDNIIHDVHEVCAKGHCILCITNGNEKCEDYSNKAYPEHILRRIRQINNLEENETSRDDEFNEMSPNEIFAGVLQWELGGSWDYTIKGWIEDIYGIDLDEEV